MSDNEYMVTQKEAADFLNVSTKSISRYRKRGLPYKLILNPVTGKQEVRFRSTDLERWDEGRQLLATYARDGEDDGGKAQGENRMPEQAGHGFLAELLAAYKEQIELLRDQLEDMREQLARRDRQIDDLMRLMVGLQLEYKPLAAEPAAAGAVEESQGNPDKLERMESMELFETIRIPESVPQPQVTPSIEVVRPVTSVPDPGPAKKIYSREKLSASILQLRRKGKSYDEIAGGLNKIAAATLSGQPAWTALEVRTLLPSLVDMDPRRLTQGGEF